MTLLPVSKQNEGEGQIPHQNAQTTPPANAEPVSQNSALVASVPPPPDVSLVQTFQKDCDRIYASIRTKQDVLTDDAIKLREEASEKVCDTDFLQEVRTFAFRPPDISWMPWDGTPKMEAQKGRRYASSMLVDIESLKRYNSELGRLGRLSEKENGILAEAARSVADSGAKVVGKLATQLKMEEDARQQLTVRMQGLEDDVEVSDNLLNAKNLEIGELNKEVTSVKKKLQVWHDRLEASVLRVDDPRARTTQVSPDDTVATNPSKDHKDRPGFS